MPGASSRDAREVPFITRPLVVNPRRARTQAWRADRPELSGREITELMKNRRGPPLPRDDRDSGRQLPELDRHYEGLRSRLIRAGMVALDNQQGRQEAVLAEQRPILAG